MSDDDDIQEIASERITVPETNRLYRLTPVFEDLSRPHRQIALVPADNENDARALATAADALGRDWRDESAFRAESIHTEERHVIGDVIFRSTPVAVTTNGRQRNQNA
jgi:hypothetical protein